MRSRARITRARRIPAVALMALAPLHAQDPRVAQGEKVFATNCSVPYCHGANGAAGRAPKLTGHTLTVRELTDAVSNGVAAKGMPAFRAQLSPDDLGAVIAYAMSLRGNGPASPNTRAPARAAVDAPGKALFFDAVRMGGCSRCHELGQHGSRVAPAIKNVPADLRAVDASRTVTVLVSREAPFPGFVLEQSEKRVRVYDLSSRLPVLRTFAPGAVKITPGSTWKHRDAVADYTDAELRQIAAYLQSAIAK